MGKLRAPLEKGHISKSYIGDAGTLQGIVRTLMLQRQGDREGKRNEEVSAEIARVCVVNGAKPRAVLCWDSSTDRGIF